MAKQSLETIKNWFRTALKPTQAQFWDTWDSFWHKDEKIPTASVTGLDDALTSKASTELVNYLRTEVEAFESSLAEKLDRGGYAGTAQDLNAAIQNILLVLASDDTTLDELQEIVNFIKQNKQVLDTLGISNIAGLQAALDGKVDKVAGKQLSTEDFTTVLKNKLDAIDMASKLDRGGYAGTAQDLNTAIQNILLVLASDDTTLDELQEIVNFIKQNKQVLDTLGISNIAGLQAALDKTVTADAALTAGRIPVVAANGRKLADSQLYVDGDIVRGARGIAFGDAAEIVDDGSANCSMSLWQRLTISVYDDVADAMNYFDFTKQGALYLKQLVANKLSISEGAGAGKTLRSDAVGTAKWVGAESIEVLTNTLDFSKGDLYVKTLYGDTTLAISNPIPGKTILLDVDANNYELTLPGVNVSNKGYFKNNLNRIRITCEAVLPVASYIYEYLSSSDGIINVGRNSVLDFSKGNYFRYAGAWGDSTFEIINHIENRSVFFEIYSEDIITIIANSSTNVLNDLPEYSAIVTAGEVNVVEFRNGRFKILPPQTTVGYTRENNEIRVLYDNTSIQLAGMYIENAGYGDIAVSWDNTSRRILYGSGDIYRRAEYVKQSLARYYTRDGARIISFLSTIGQSFGNSVKELTLNSQPLLEVLDLYGLSDLFYAFNGAIGGIDLGNYTELKYFRLRFGQITSVELGACSKLNRIIIDNSNVLAVYLPLTINEHDFSVTINATLSEASVNQLLALAVTYTVPSGTKSIVLGTGTAAPTGQGLSDKAALIAAGWTVTTN